MISGLRAMILKETNCTVPFRMAALNVYRDIARRKRSKPDDLNKTLLVEYFRQVRNIAYDDNSKWL